MKKIERITLKQICANIAQAVEKEEFDYWIARREQWFEDGPEATSLTIEDDIAEGFIWGFLE